SYLKHQLYPYHEEWVLAFTYHSFNCGVQSTKRVEVYNTILKKSLNRITSLMDIVVAFVIDKACSNSYTGSTKIATNQIDQCPHH
ncbi:91_t:CDS:2, partial [Gigaspora rosea]